MNKSKTINYVYYQLKPFIPRRLQIFLRRKLVNRKRLLCRDIWPIDESAANPPEGWSGWPGGKRFALILTHDVETMKGCDKCSDLMKVEQELGFKSSFNFIPEKYDLSPEFRRYLKSNGFEVGIHDLNHDGKLYKSRKIFKKRAEQINRYLKDWKAVGFRSGSMHSNLEWMHDLDIRYDASTFDTDPFEPSPEGFRTIFPFWVSSNSLQTGYVELPYTLPQDFTQFVLLREESIDIWKKKLDWIAQHGGMALLITHPDYMNFSGGALGPEEYPTEYYRDFLEYIKSEYKDQYWHVLPEEIVNFWRQNFARQSV